jgi:uncharacterized membrane protein YfcA
MLVGILISNRVHTNMSETTLRRVVSVVLIATAVSRMMAVS